MRKLLLTCFTFTLALTALAGCRVEGEIDPDGDVSSGIALPR